MRGTLKIAAASAALAIGGIANAAVISDSDVFGEVETNLTGGAGANPAVLTVDQFNSPGTLTMIEIFLTGTTTGSVRYLNDTATELDIEDDIVIDFGFDFFVDNVFDAGINQAFIVGTSDSPNASTTTGFGQPPIGSINLQPDEEENIGPISRTNAAPTITFTDPADFTPFLGAGTFDTGCATTTNSVTVQTGGPADVFPELAAGCTIEIVYTFDEPVNPVPAPAGLFLVAAGLLGMRRFRK